MAEWTVVDRDGWGARRPRSRFTMPTPARDWWLHHTGTDKFGAGAVRAAQRYHMDTRQWSDIGYSWLYDVHARTFFEGRGFGVVGAHTEGENDTSHGLCVLGDWHGAGPGFPDHGVADIASFIVDAHRGGFGPARLTGGHRDTKATACPGDRLQFRIGAVNHMIDNLMSEDDMALTDAEQQTVREIHRALKEQVDPPSNGGFAKWAVLHLRDHPSSGGGLSEDDVRRIATEVVRQIRLP